MPLSTEPLEDRYFEWLCSLVGEDTIETNKSHIKLLRVLHSVAFEWRVPNDDNREEDGRALRFEFQESYDLSEDAWVDMTASMLEMILALARRMAFQQSLETEERFWHLLKNLGVADITDRNYDESMHRHILNSLTKLNNRTYTYYGEGGLFPLRYCRENQQYVELWDQMANYILENDPLFR